MAKNLRNKKGISPVVATVILVAVTIVVAVAVSYWMGGIAGLYTKFERVEIVSAYPSAWTNGTAGWTVTINLKNSGSADASITGILINGKPTSEYGANVTSTTLPVPIKAGQSAALSLDLKQGGAFTSGTTIEIKMHSANGQDYPKSLTLD